MGPDSNPPSNLLITGALRAPAAPGGQAGGRGQAYPAGQEGPGPEGVQATLGWSPAPGLVGTDWATSGDSWRPRRDAKVHPPSTQSYLFP